MYKEATVILPTLDEENNIGEILRRLLACKGLKVIVVDDGSSDSTQEIVKKFARINKNISLLDRSKEHEKGIAASILAGAKKAKTKYLIVMDADLQHPLDKIPDLLNALKTNDIVVSCREEIHEWPTHRRLISFGANTLAKASLKIRNAPSCSDPVSGCFAFRRRMLSKIEERRVVGKGFKVLFDFLKQLPEGTRIAEIHFAFRGRASGNSKLRMVHWVYFLCSLFS